MIKAHKVRFEFRNLWHPLLLVAKIVDDVQVLLKFIGSVSINYQKVIHVAATDIEVLDAKLMALGGLRHHFGPLLLLGHRLADLSGWSALLGRHGVFLAHGHRQVAEISAVLALMGILVHMLSVHHVRDVF